VDEGQEEGSKPRQGEHQTVLEYAKLKMSWQGVREGGWGGSEAGKTKVSSKREEIESRKEAHDVSAQLKSVLVACKSSDRVC
jgi:hypothetical protein